MNQSAQSPVTGILSEEDVMIDFGKHAGKTIHQIQIEDPEFYESLMEKRGSGVFAIKREAHMDGHKTYRLYLNPLAHLDQ